MKKRRIYWLAAGVLAATLYFFENNPGTLTLLVSVLVLPLLGAVTLAGKTVGVTLSAPPVLSKGKTVRVTAQVKNFSLLLRGRVELTLHCRNLRTGEEQNLVQALCLGPREQDRVLFDLTCPYAGRVEIQAGDVRILDPFGLFARRTEAQAEGAVTVLPEPFPCELSLTDRDPATADNETEILNRPGGDPGESFGLREYRPGDAIRRIHWKLSEKTDQLMVREFGQPGDRETALLLDRSGETTAERTEAMTEILVSFSEALLEAQVSHSVFWLNADGTLAEYPIQGEEDLEKMTRDLLALPPRQEGPLLAAFERRQCFSHVVVISQGLPENENPIPQMGRVSFLLPRGLAEEGMQPDGSFVLGYEPSRYAADLCRMEV